MGLENGRLNSGLNLVVVLKWGFTVLAC